MKLSHIVSLVNLSSLLKSTDLLFLDKLETPKPFAKCPIV